MQVVREALKRRPGARIRPTCARHPTVAPCQLRRWIRAYEKEVRDADQVLHAATGEASELY